MDLSYACFKENSIEGSEVISVDYLGIKDLASYPFEIFRSEESASVENAEQSTIVGIRQNIDLRKVWKSVELSNEEDGKYIDFVQIARVVVYDAISDIRIIDKSFPVGFDLTGNNGKKLYPSDKTHNLVFRFYEIMGNQVRIEDWKGKKRY